MSLEVPEHLIRSVKSRDKQSFGKLVDHCSGYVYNLSLKMVGNSDDAYDTSQEIFIKIWDKIDSYNSDFKFSTWLYRIVINSCLDRLRSSKLQKRLFRSSNENDDMAANIPSDNKLEFEERQLVEFIRVLSRKLTGKQYSVFLLHDLEGLDQDEVSQILGVSKGSVKSNLHLARKTIRHLLKTVDQVKIKQNNEV